MTARQQWEAAREERDSIPSYTPQWYGALRTEIMTRVRAAPRGLSAPKKPGGRIKWT